MITTYQKKIRVVAIRMMKCADLAISFVAVFSGGCPMNSVTFRSTSIAVCTGSAGLIYIAKERYDATGIRSDRVLSFERGEELEVFDPLPTAEWWEVWTCVCVSTIVGCKYIVQIPYSVRSKLFW